MKRGLIIFGMLLSFLVLNAQDFYTVQVRSLSRETPLTMEELQAGMWQYKVDGQTKCFLGRFDTYEEAKAALIPLKVAKYAGAFVVSSDKIFGSDVPQGVSVQSQQDVIVEDEPEEEAAPARVVDNTPISVYTIQIAAYRYPLYTKEFSLEDEVMEFYCSDNIYRYSVGRFEVETEARDYLNAIRGSGYPDAFLIDYEKYEAYRIE